MKKFELWLDESGEFEDEKYKNKEYMEGSLVGGVLVDLDILKTNAENLFEGKIHANELEKKDAGNILVPILEKAKSRRMEFIIFQNDKKVNILDNNITYLNVLCEGIVKLIKKLLLQYGSIDINIIYASRKLVGEGNIGIIDKNSYYERIKEKIEIEFTKNAIPKNSSKLKYNLKYLRANKSDTNKEERKVNLADIICNVYLTRNSSKFNHEQRKKIDELYNSEYIFYVFERTSEQNVKRLYEEGNISQAFLEVFTSNDKEREELKNKYLDNILKQIDLLDSKYVHFQFIEFLSKLELMIKYNRNNEKNLNLLIYIRENMKEKLDITRSEVKEFLLNVELLILEIANHSGDNALEEEQINRCMNIIKDLNFRVENLESYFRVIIRKAIYESNIFKYEQAIETSSLIIAPLKGILDLINDPDINGKITKEIKSDMLGKAYGTRLQARTFLINKDKSQENKAREDSENAINWFTMESDKSQQLQYRSQIECESGNYKEALDYIIDSLGNDKKSINSYKDLFKKLEEIKYNIFHIMHISRIIGKASLSNNDISKLLFNSFNSSNLFVNFSKSNLQNLVNDYSHPYEVILWNIGRFYINNNSINAAIDYYNSSNKICNKNQRCFTMRGIGLGIMSEKAALLKLNSSNYLDEYKKSTKEFVIKYKEFMKDTEGYEINNYFKSWESTVIEIEKTKDENLKATLLLNLSKNINY